MTRVKTYMTEEELLKDFEAQRAAADAAVGPEASQFKVGGFYARFMPELGFIVYGEILDPVQEEIDSGADETEVEYQKHLRDQPHMKNYLYTRSYSVACPHGEYGDVHVASMNVPLTKKEFERARALGWPRHPKELFEEVLVLRKQWEVPKA